MYFGPTTNNPGPSYLNKLQGFKYTNTGVKKLNHNLNGFFMVFSKLTLLRNKYDPLHYFNPNFRPGWELPLTWATEVPAEGNLVLTYASSLKGCLPIWSERIKLRKYTCIPISAPLPEGVERTHRPTPQPTEYPTSNPSVVPTLVLKNRFSVPFNTF